MVVPTAPVSSSGRRPMRSITVIATIVAIRLVRPMTTA
jgi:hypothetical protein